MKILYAVTFFEGKVTAYYPADNDTWYNVESNYKNDNVTWVPYDPSTLNAASISEDTINEEVAQNEENSEFTDNVTVTFSVRENTVPLLQDKLTQLSNGKYIFKEIGEKFAKVE